MLIDLASKPGGVDFSAAKELGIHAVQALSLPGKTAPRAAAEIIKNTIYNICLLYTSLLARNLSRYRLKSPLLCSGLLPDDKIIEKSYTSDRIQQISFF